MEVKVSFLWNRDVSGTRTRLNDLARGGEEEEERAMEVERGGKIKMERCVGMHSKIHTRCINTANTHP